MALQVRDYMTCPQLPAMSKTTSAPGQTIYVSGIRNRTADTNRSLAKIWVP